MGRADEVVDVAAAMAPVDVAKADRAAEYAVLDDVHLQQGAATSVVDDALEMVAGGGGIRDLVDEIGEKWCEVIAIVFHERRELLGVADLDLAQFDGAVDRQPAEAVEAVGEDHAGVVLLFTFRRGPACA